jgi:hypothetical protein
LFQVLGTFANTVQGQHTYEHFRHGTLDLPFSHRLAHVISNSHMVATNTNRDLHEPRIHLTTSASASCARHSDVTRSIGRQQTERKTVRHSQMDMRESITLPATLQSSSRNINCTSPPTLQYNMVGVYWVGRLLMLPPVIAVRHREPPTGETYLEWLCGVLGAQGRRASEGASAVAAATRRTLHRH